MTEEKLLLQLRSEIEANLLKRMKEGLAEQVSETMAASLAQIMEPAKLRKLVDKHVAEFLERFFERTLGSNILLDNIVNAAVPMILAAVREKFGPPSKSG